MKYIQATLFLGVASLAFGAKGGPEEKPNPKPSATVLKQDKTSKSATSKYAPLETSPASTNGAISKPNK